MPLSSSWFYKLRTRRRSAARGLGAADAADAAGMAGETGSRRRTTTWPVQEVVPCPCSSPPNRASYYVPTGDRRAFLPLSPGKGNAKLRDTQFPRSPHPNDIVFDVVAVGDGRFDCLKAMPELKLRPILTRPAGAKRNGNGSDSSTCSAAASPTARVRRRRRRRRRLDVKGREDAQVLAVTGRHARHRWLYESLVVLKESADPEEDFLESMEEMIAAADGAALRSPGGLEELLACYLALNAAEHHGAIVGAFSRAWLVDRTTDAVKPTRLQAAAQGR